MNPKDLSGTVAHIDPLMRLAQIEVNGFHLIKQETLVAYLHLNSPFEHDGDAVDGPPTAPDRSFSSRIQRQIHHRKLLRILLRQHVPQAGVLPVHGQRILIRL